MVVVGHAVDTNFGTHMIRALLLLLCCVTASAQVSTPAISRTNVGRALYPLTSAERVNCGATRANTDQYYDVGHLWRYKAVGDRITDNVVQFNRALCSAAFSPDRRRVYVPVGDFRFASKPDDIAAVIEIVGEAADGSVLVCDYNEATVSRGCIQNAPGQGGFSIRNLRIHKGLATTGGAAINITASVGAAAGYIHIEDVVVTTFGGTWNYGIYVDGTARILSPQGVRALHIEDSIFFAATTEAAVFMGTVAADISASFFPAGGTSSLVRIGGTAAVPTNYLQLNGPFLESVALDQISTATIRSGTSLTITDTAAVTGLMVSAAGGILSDTKSRAQYGHLMPSVTATGNLTLSTGCTTTPTLAYRYTQSGRMASVSIQNDIFCTSNATTLVLSGLPAAVTPTTSRAYLAVCSDNGAARAPCSCVVTALSTITCFKDLVSGAWTASGSRIVNAQTFTYPLD